jgi:hypothetical protein
MLLIDKKIIFTFFTKTDLLFHTVLFFSFEFVSSEFYSDGFLLEVATVNHPVFRLFKSRDFSSKSPPVFLAFQNDRIYSRKTFVGVVSLNGEVMVVLAFPLFFLYLSHNIAGY